MHYLISSLQSAYRKHHSIKTATLRITSDFYDSVDSGYVAVLVILDLGAASDTV